MKGGISIDTNAYAEFLLANLRDAKYASGKREIVSRCNDCADIGDHGHLYISIPQTENEPSLYFCFKCQSSGIVTPYKLMSWNIFNTEWNMELMNHNKGVSSNPLNSKYFITGKFNINNTFVRDGELTNIKLAYINNRLGLNLTVKDAIDNKIVLNINDLLKSNYINTVTRSVNFINELNASFLGFLSFDNGFINLRNINENSWIKDRYVNYNIMGKYDNSQKFYICPSVVNICDPTPIKVHVAEGPFDILSVKYNLRKDNYQCIYGAATGNTYKNLIRSLIVDEKLMNLEINLYRDNDPNPKTFATTTNIINDLIQFLIPYGYPMYVHSNTLYKDMGVSKDKINEKIDRVL